MVAKCPICGRKLSGRLCPVHGTVVQGTGKIALAQRRTDTSVDLLGNSVTTVDTAVDGVSSQVSSLATSVGNVNTAVGGVSTAVGNVQTAINSANSTLGTKFPVGEVRLFVVGTAPSGWTQVAYSKVVVVGDDGAGGTTEARYYRYTG
jgi:type IV secretory pathway TrbL component